MFGNKRTKVFWIVFIVVLTVTSHWGLISKYLQDQPYLVLYAFDQEGLVLKNEMSDIKSTQHLGREVYTGVLSGQPIILAESGIGMNNASMTAQKMVDEYNPKAVIFSGIAGGIDSTVHIGDIVVASSWIEHDYGYIGAEGFAHNGIKVYQPDKGAIEKTIMFSSDESFIGIAGNIKSDEIQLQKIGERIPNLITGGVGVSGNCFIDSYDKRVWLSDKFEALVVDMESSAVAQVCTVNSLPFIVFRSASDLAGGSGSETAHEEMAQFFEVAAENSAKVVMAFLEQL